MNSSAFNMYLQHLKLLKKLHRFGDQLAEEQFVCRITYAAYRIDSFGTCFVFARLIRCGKLPQDMFGKALFAEQL